MGNWWNGMDWMDKQVLAFSGGVLEAGFLLLA